jgi:hypothetical protein
MLLSDRCKPDQFADLRGKRGARSLPRLEKALLAGDEESARAGLEVDHGSLEAVGRHEHLLRGSSEPRGLPQVVDSGEEHREGAPDDDDQQAARDCRPADQSGSSARRARLGDLVGATCHRAPR